MELLSIIIEGILNIFQQKNNDKYNDKKELCLYLTDLIKTWEKCRIGLGKQDVWTSKLENHIEDQFSIELFANPLAESQKIAKTIDGKKELFCLLYKKQGGIGEFLQALSDYFAFYTDAMRINNLEVMGKKREEMYKRIDNAYPLAKKELEKLKRKL